MRSAPISLNTSQRSTIRGVAIQRPGRSVPAKFRRPYLTQCPQTGLSGKLRAFQSSGKTLRLFPAVGSEDHCRTSNALWRWIQLRNIHSDDASVFTGAFPRLNSWGRKYGQYAAASSRTSRPSHSGPLRKKSIAMPATAKATSIATIRLITWRVPRNSRWRPGRPPLRGRIGLQGQDLPCKRQPVPLARLYPRGLFPPLR
jgi:hypothetical protein